MDEDIIRFAIGVYRFVYEKVSFRIVAGGFLAILWLCIVIVWPLQAERPIELLLWLCIATLIGGVALGFTRCAVWWAIHTPDCATKRNRKWRHLIRAKHLLNQCYPGLVLYIICVSCGLPCWAKMARTDIPPFAHAWNGCWVLLLFITGALVAKRFYHVSIKQVWDALRNWTMYRPHPFAVGLFQYPGFFKNYSTRLGLVGLSLVLISTLLLPAAHYFPVTMYYSKPWLEIFDELHDTDRLQAALQDEEFGQRLQQADKRAYAGIQERLKELEAENETVRTTRQKALLAVLKIPEYWGTLGVKGMHDNPVFFTWTFLLSCLLCIGSPLVILFSSLLMIAGPVLRKVETEVSLFQPAELNEWSHYVNKVQQSTNQTERNSLFLGTHHAGQYPVLLPVSLLREHAHIMGDTGSGKTARALAPMISQLIQMSAQDREDLQNNPHGTEPASIVIIDLKGDPGLFAGMRKEAAAAGMQFKWFTNQLDLSTHIFNPLTQSHLSSFTPNQLSEILMEGLGLAHGDGYGRSFFSRSNRKMLSRIVESYRDQIHSFADLQSKVDPNSSPLMGEKKFKISPQDRDAAMELFSTIETLAKFPAFNYNYKDVATGKCNQSAFDHQIDMCEVFNSPQLVYFYLPAAIEAASVKEIGKMALYSLLGAAIHHETERKKPRQVYLFVDEFQQIVSENLEIVLRQARSKNIAAILANQTISDLDTHGGSLIPVVQANTRFKQIFAATDLVQRRALIDSSGTTTRERVSWTEDNRDFEIPFFQNTISLKEVSSEVSVSEVEGPRLTQNDIIDASDNPRQSIVHISRGAGFAQFGGYPFVLESDFHITGTEYESRARTAWPQPTAETVMPSYQTPESQTLSEPSKPAKTPATQPVSNRSASEVSTSEAPKQELHKSSSPIPEPSSSTVSETKPSGELPKTTVLGELFSALDEAAEEHAAEQESARKQKRH